MAAVPRPPSLRRLVLLVACLAPGLAMLPACGDDDGPAPVAEVDGDGPIAGLPQEFATRKVTGEAAGFGLLSGVRALVAPERDGVEQVVFEFEFLVPGVVAEYVERPVVQDGSGEEVDVAGRAVLGVRFDPASGADLSGAELRMVYTGPSRIDPPTSTVVEVVKVGDFEGILHWAIGLEEKVPFRVRALDDPGRLVVEFRARS